MVLHRLIAIVLYYIHISGICHLFHMRRAAAIYYVTLRRASAYYVVIIILPGMIVTVLSFSVFFTSTEVSLSSSPLTGSAIIHRSHPQLVLDTPPALVAAHTNTWLHSLARRCTARCIGYIHPIR